MFTIDDASHPTGAALYREARHRRDERIGETFGAAFAHLAALARRFNEWRSRRATHAALMRLDDHLLSDIGLNRTDVAIGLVPENRDEVQHPLQPQGFEVEAVKFPTAGTEITGFILRAQ